MNKFHPQKGTATLSTIFGGCLAAIIVYVAYHILPFYYYYFEMQNQMQAVIRLASTHTDQQIRKKLAYHMVKMDIPASPDELLISRQEDFMKISLKYKEVFSIPWGMDEKVIYVFDFKPEAQGRF
jgi:hypothetical protein